MNQLLGGWSINTIYTHMSGEPFAVRSGAFTSNGSHESRAVCRVRSAAQLQELAGFATRWSSVVQTGEPALTCGVDLSQPFCIPAPGQNGAGRNIFVAPSYWNVDLGFIKTFPITSE